MTTITLQRNICIHSKFAHLFHVMPTEIIKLLSFYILVPTPFSEYVNIEGLVPSNYCHIYLMANYH